MELESQQHIDLDEALVPRDDQVKIVDVPQIYVQRFWYTIVKNKNTQSYQFQLDNQQFKVGVEIFREIDSRQTNAKRREEMSYPRFTKLIINHFLSKHNTLPKRQGSFINTIKYDSVLGKLKFVNKGEDKQKYGMSIPDSMMNDVIRNCAHYLIYLDLSTNTEVNIPKVGKGSGKGLMGKKKVDVDVQTERKKVGVPRKKRLFTTDDNILSDHDEADKLAKSVSLTEAEEREEERRLHETHATLVIGREVNLEADKSADDTQKKKKLKELDVLSSDDEITEIDGSEKAAGEEKTRNEKVDDEKVGEEKAEQDKAIEEKVIEEQAGDEQTRVIVPEPQQEKPTLLTSVEDEVQSMVEILVIQKNLAVQRPPLVYTTVTLLPIEKKYEAISKIDHTKAINKSVQAHLKKALPKVVSDFVFVDEDDMDNQFDAQPSLKKRRHDDQDPHADANKDTKKRCKDSDSSSSKKGKDQAPSSKEDKASSKPSATKKAMDAEEPSQYVVVDTEEQTNDDAAPTQDRSKWFKQDAVVRPETPDPEWYKGPNADDSPEKPWFNEMMNAKKDLVTFDDLMGSTIDFTKFAKHCLKKDKITKADLKGPAFKLLKGNYRNYIKLEYNIEQCYLALTDQIDSVNPEGDRCPYNLSKPLLLQGHPGRTTIPVNFYYNKDLEYLKEIVVRQADQKEYVFKEADFPKLHLNDIVDMYLLYAQNKLFISQAMNKLILVFFTSSCEHDVVIIDFRLELVLIGFDLSVNLNFFEIINQA
ncbi:hypothetical protein Tco_1142666 [Tanacetum coccineum]